VEYPTHRMHFKVTIDGWECWTCPRCDRCVRIRWWPAPEREICAHGDETVVHTGGWRGLLHDRRWADMPPPAGEKDPMARVGASFSDEQRKAIESLEDGAPADLVSDSLEPWLRWMRTVGMAE